MSQFDPTSFALGAFATYLCEFVIRWAYRRFRSAIEQLERD